MDALILVLVIVQFGLWALLARATIMNSDSIRDLVTTIKDHMRKEHNFPLD